MSPRTTAVALVLALALTTSACRAPGRAGADPASAPAVRVVTTIFPLYEFARAVGGERVQVTLLLPPGVAAHDFDPTPRDMERVARADLFLYNGAGFEPWIDRVLEVLQQSASKTLAVDASAGIALLNVAAEVVKVGGEADAGGPGDAHDDADPGGAGPADPHVWLDPQRAGQQVEAIRDALAALDPGGAAGYARNAEAYLAELRALDAAFAAGLAACERRELVVQHAAFGYLAQRYGLEQVAVSGLAPELEPTPRQMADLAAWARARGVRVVYYETAIDPRVAEALASEAGARVMRLHPIENPTAAELEAGATYLSLMRDNLANLRAGLGCGGD